jgi:hypothetical protein
MSRQGGSSTRVDQARPAKRRYPRTEQTFKSDKNERVVETRQIADFAA